MEGETLARLEKLLGRELGNAEKTRLQRIQDILKIGPNDALWSIIVALEYQRTYYEELPEKIREVSMEAITELTKVTKKSTIQPGSTREEKKTESGKTPSHKNPHPNMPSLGNLYTLPVTTVWKSIHVGRFFHWLRTAPATCIALENAGGSSYGDTLHDGKHIRGNFGRKNL